MNEFRLFKNRKKDFKTTLRMILIYPVIISIFCGSIINLGGGYHAIKATFFLISFPYAIIFFLTLLSEYFQNYPKLTEEEVFKIIKDFFTIVKQWDEKDYLLTNNLILQENYWSCEIDILLITKKWIYVIEVKHQLSKWLSGGINDEYLKASPWGPHPRNQIYSPFYQILERTQRGSGTRARGNEKGSGWKRTYACWGSEGNWANFSLGQNSWSIRAEAAGQYQHASVCNVPVLCGQRAARDAGKAFFTPRIYDQIRLGYAVVQYLVSDKL